jgi:hypothetical protein
MNERHQGQEAVIGDPENSHFAVALGNVFHQPVDGVVGVRRLVDRRRILGPVDRTVHKETAFGAKFSAYILNDPDIASLDNHVGRIVITIQRGPQMSTHGMVCQGGGIVRSSRQQYG